MCYLSSNGRRQPFYQCVINIRTALKLGTPGGKITTQNSLAASVVVAAGGARLVVFLLLLLLFFVVVLGGGGKHSFLNFKLEFTPAISQFLRSAVAQIQGSKGC